MDILTYIDNSLQSLEPVVKSKKKNAPLAIL